MRNQENTAPGYDRMQDQLNNWLTGTIPVAETSDVLLDLMVNVPESHLDAQSRQLLVKLLAFLNQVQIVQFEMGRMVSHA